MDRKPNTGSLSEMRREVYQQAVTVADSDAVHDLLIQYGPEILDKGFPYIIIAARNRQRSAHRVGRRQRELLEQEWRSETASPRWDAYSRVSHLESFRILLDAMAEMSDEDVLTTWRHAEGYSDKEIQEEWDDLGLDPPRPSLALLRKRRERARAWLQKRVQQKLSSP